MSIDKIKMREEFETFWLAPEQDELRASCAQGWAFNVWQASRAALVVELPPAPVPQKRYEGRYTQVESAYHQGQMSVTRAIEAAGIKIKE